MSSAVRGSGSATAGSGLTLSTNTYVQGANMGSVPGMFPLGDGPELHCSTRYDSTRIWIRSELHCTADISL